MTRLVICFLLTVLACYCDAVNYVSGSVKYTDTIRLTYDTCAAVPQTLFNNGMFRFPKTTLVLVDTICDHDTSVIPVDTTSFITEHSEIVDEYECHFGRNEFLISGVEATEPAPFTPTITNWDEKPISIEFLQGSCKHIWIEEYGGKVFGGVWQELVSVNVVCVKCYKQEKRIESKVSPTISDGIVPFPLPELPRNPIFPRDVHEIKCDTFWLDDDSIPFIIINQNPIYYNGKISP